MFWILFIEGAIFLAVIVIIIYLIFQRIEEKKKENFEDREY